MEGEKTLYIELFQPFAQYRNPFTFYYAQSYPLPPRSTVIGMLQNATEGYYNTEFWDLKVSIHGGFETVFWNYQNLIKGDVEIGTNCGKIELRNQKRPLYGRVLKSQRTPVYQQELFNGRLFLFIRGKSDLIDKIEKAFKSPKKILSLGRSEDIIFIKDVHEIKKDELNTKIVKRDLWIRYPMYILKRMTKYNEFPIRNEKYPIFSIPTKVLFKNKEKTIKTKGELSRTTEREVKFAPVIYTGYDYVLYLKDSIEVEECIINKKKFKIPSKWGWICDN